MFKSLGYMGVSAPRIDEWRDFATRLLGMQCAEQSTSRLALRIDDRAQRLVVDTRLEPGRHYYGWEVADAATLDAVAARVEAAGTAVRLEPASLAAERAVDRLISFQDPAGNRVEAFCGGWRADTPFSPSRALSGFRTGELGLGHVVLTVADPQPLLAFYQDVLGFRLSDYMLHPFQAYFLHTNARHHSLALIGTGVPGLHHVMVELRGLDDVGQAYDIALTEPDRVGVTLGRHINDFMTSFYSRTPSGFMIEYGWGGREIDVATWQSTELEQGASLWGHERHWLPAEGRREAVSMRLKAAADGCRAPVQVLEGHYQVMKLA